MFSLKIENIWNRQTSPYWRCLAVLLVLGSGLIPSQTMAADRIVLKYGFLRGVVEVNELVEFSRTGQPSPALSFYLLQTKQEPERVRQALSQPVPIEPMIVNQITYSPLGDVLLDPLSQVIQTPENQANKQAIRAAVVLSAMDGKLSLLEVIQNYPTSEVQIDGDKLVQAYLQLNQVREQLKKMLEEVLSNF